MLCVHVSQVYTCTQHIGMVSTLYIQFGFFVSCISDAASPAVRTHVNFMIVTDTYIIIHIYVHHENRSLIQSLVLMHSAIITILRRVSP